MIAGDNRANGRGKLALGICILLAAITWLVFGQTLGHEFINFDDPDYVVKNPGVTRGFTPQGIGWALTHSHSANWHPLTTFTHMLDCQLYGLWAGGHHLTNVVLHTLAVLLLFLVLRDMTGGPGRPGDTWRSAFVAALFAIHPLHVESVAWVSERKDVLSAVFFMLTLAAYLRYVRGPSLASYLLVALVFTLGLMSKPMLVTLPVVLLLLDYWPLGRFKSQAPPAGNARSLHWLDRQNTAHKLILEKIPLVLLSAASCLATILAQRQSVISIEVLPLWVRVYEAFVSCVTYIWQMFWPANLALLYPYPIGRLSIWPLVLAIAILVAVTALAFKWRVQRPYLITGWLWYLGMLFPVIGIVQVGNQARADRYTYLPQIGLYIAVSWAASELLAPWKHRRQVLSALAVTAIVLLTWRAWIQTSYWKNSESIWNQTLAATPGNAFAEENLGLVLLEKGRVDDAISHFQQALKAKRQADSARAHYNLGNAFLEKGLADEATFQYRKALELKPDYVHGKYNLGVALFRAGRIDDAIACWQEVLSSHRDEAQTHESLGDALLKKRLARDAVSHYEQSLQINPGSAPVLNKLAWLFSTCPDGQLRNGSRAIGLAEQADRLAGGKDPLVIRTLAAAYAEGGRFNDAINAAQRALQLAAAQRDSALANQLRMDIDLYRVKFPLR